MFVHNAYRSDEVLVGESLAIQRVREQLQRAAHSEVPVLITGESGTGKELVARLLHHSSTRRSHNFVKVSCPALTDKSLMDEIFDHDQSLSSGKVGCACRSCSEADKGTLFLDEIGELDLTLQTKVLCALQDCQNVRLGATTKQSVNVRLTCTTNRNLEDEVVQGRFRADLFHRINVVRIHLPALRERASDVPVLMDYFLGMYDLRQGGLPEGLSTSFKRKLVEYDWPGNVRELENMAKRYVLFGGEEHVLSAIEQTTRLRPSKAIDLTTPLRVQTKRARQDLEKSIILGVLEAHRWNRRKTAQSLDISYRALLYKIKEGGLPRVSSATRGVPRLPTGLTGSGLTICDSG